MRSIGELGPLRLDGRRSDTAVSEHDGPEQVSAPTTCGLCDLFDPSQHPGHPEVPRCGEKDYEALTPRRSKAWMERIWLIRPRCERKRRYKSLRSAERVAKRMTQNTVHAYECRHCRGAHVGKSDRLGII